jgi:arylsulfatase A-like enzyme
MFAFSALVALVFAPGDGVAGDRAGGESTPVGVGLDYDEPTRISIAESTLGPAPERIAVRGPFRLTGVVDGTRAYEAPNPVRPRALFYERQPLEMEVFRDDRKIAYVAEPEMRGLAGSWEVNAESVVLRVMHSVSRPKDGQYTMRYPAATEREESLRFRGGDPRTWAFRSVQVNEVSRHGVLLPAPSSVAWTVDAPAEAHLRFDVGIVPPEIEEGLGSDGTNLSVLVNGTELVSLRVLAGEFQPVDLALPAAGRVEIALQSSDDDPTVDHLFVASPRVYAPQAAPQRVVMAFIDTLRRDHLGTYGYPRPTTPELDAWAKNAVVFEETRSVAPWTLPSTRALWTGRQPEWWSESTTLQEALSARGWATAAFMGNVYLSSNFEMDRGWGEHSCVNWPGAAYETARAREFLDRHENENSLVLVHFMDLHLPYKEPGKYRNMWVRKEPSGLEPYFNRTMLLREAGRQKEVLRDYLIDRYDQNLRYVNDQLSAFLRDLGSDTTVVLFADHGEEFFDHGDLEHGHTLYDELLRVPLVIRSPKLKARRAEGPTSLMDVAPTLLELLELPPDLLGAIEGRSLVSAARSGSDPRLASRPLAFGRVLYGPEQWGSYRDGFKYITKSGLEKLFDLRTDLAETHDLAVEGANLDGPRSALADGLGRELLQAFRVTPLGRPGKPIRVEMHIPGGVARGWVGDDPTDITAAMIESMEGDTVVMRFQSRVRDNREVFLVPNQPAESIVGDCTIRVLEKNGPVQPLRAKPQDGSGAVLARSRVGPTAALVTWAIVPAPGGEATSATNAELMGALEALGYATPEGGSGEDDREDGDDAPPEEEEAGGDPAPSAP